MADVLVVDDDPVVGQLVGLLLRHEGHCVTCAQSGDEALRLLGNGQRPQLIVLDVMMPDLDGLSVLRAIREQPRWNRISVVMFTAMSDDNTRAEAARLGAQDYLVKGRDWQEVYRRITLQLAVPDVAAEPPEIRN